MKLDYKTPLKEMGLMQRRRLFHVILGGLALFCVLVALVGKHSAKNSSSSSSNATSDVANAVAVEQAAKTAEGTRATAGSAVQSQSKKTESIEIPKLALKNDAATQDTHTIKDGKPVKQTIMTLAEVKKTDQDAVKGTAKANESTNGKANEIDAKTSASNSNSDSSTSNTKNDKKTTDPKELKESSSKQACDVVTVRKGDSLAKIFKRQGYSQKDLETLMSADPKVSKKFKSLQVKQTLKIYYAQNNQVQGLALESTKGKFINLGKIVSNANLIAKKDMKDKQGIKQEINSELDNKTPTPNIALVDKQDKTETSLKSSALNPDLNNKTLGLKADAKDTKNDAFNDINLAKQIGFGKGTVKDSLYLAGKRAGLDKAVVSQLVEIFGWSIDFSLVQPNDSFRVLYEEKRKDGERMGCGPILAAEMTFKGKVHRAVRYTDKSGHTSYFSPEGHGMKETFSRYPLAFTHVSSGFGNRKHPIRHKMRKHTGVDFAAPRGTPVKCTGDGKVIFAGTRGGYGRVIEIQHGDKYSTLYAHLLKFAPKLKAGDIVKKGQEIGNVGRTGLATGNHLHYEFRVDGVHRDPLTIALPKKSPIPDAYKRHFMTHAKEMIKLMDQHENKINMVRNEFPRNE